MESLSKQELISTITKQADQIKRYETRLRDVVAAYKGLAKEKEALEISLKALNKTESTPEGGGDSVAALTLSLATLTAEKTRLEEAFQADKKVTRDKYESVIAAMKEETRSLVQQHLAEVSNLKAKISYEIQEREKERADNAAMLKELHMKFNVERKSKEKLEGQHVTSSESNATTAELEKRVRDLTNELQAAARRLARSEARAAETPPLLVRLQHKMALIEQTHSVAIRETPLLLVRLQHKMALIEQTHSVAIREEQIKAKRAEEAARKACARQEERVSVLEGRVAELSAAIGEYDARCRQDERLIHTLKESLQAQMSASVQGSDSCYDEATQKSETDNEKLADSEYIQTLIDKIHILKKELIAENEKLGFPIDIENIFKLEGYENVHFKCNEEYEKLRHEFETFKKQNKRESRGEVKDDFEVNELKFEIQTLKDKLEEYSVIIEEEKQDKADALKLYEEKLKHEQDYHTEVTTDLRERISRLEAQLSAQRARHSALLDEADSLLRCRRPSREEHALPKDVTSPPHMLHYAQELARKDLDISQLRKDKHLLEGQLRDSQRESTIEKERFKEVVRTLKEEIERLHRIQSREGANLEYLKNVVMAYLRSTDYAGRKHMLNAIAAVLHFTKAERKEVFATL
ncbi:unnamed protein product [Plutella xylostella]|uniref:(diamondback moth) hypothetical protein n=1 Tax=Plutella xylostella TaxID=51655 RepID=A0A8S4EF21_PLUXY|nr:unnamed protein product [Plutella xylostella]